MKNVFISSTFKDMHFERDIIHEKVMPALNEYAARYGESVSFCDLRWGVNTSDLESEEGNRKVLSVCLDEIDRCRPYMLVILGERYGWIPDEELIADAVHTKRDFSLDELDKSVTALEIEYGALSRPEQLMRTLFYFREFNGEDMPSVYQKEDDRHEEKLCQLKERIRRITGGRVKTYTVGWNREAECLTGLETFVSLVTQDMKDLMEQEWQEYAKLMPFDRDQRAQWDYAQQKSSQFAAREALVEEYRKKLESGQPLLFLKGLTGSGKSTLMSRLAVRLREEGDCVTLVFCGSTAMSSDALDIIKYFVYDLEERLSLPHQEEPGGKQGDDVGAGRMFLDSDRGKAEMQDSVQIWTARLAELAAAYESSGGKRMVFLLDAVDQLMPDDTRDRLFFIPPNLSGRVQMVVSCLDTFPLPGIKAEAIEQVAALADADRQEVIRGITAFLGRELEDVVIRRMAEKGASGNPLYLSLLVQRLLMMNKHDFDAITAGGDGMAAITAHQLALIGEADDTLEGVCVDILETAAVRIGGSLAKTAAMYIAVSRHGLRESDIEALQNDSGAAYNSLDFSLFIRYMRSFFILREDGRYDFAHRSIREGILSAYTYPADCQDKSCTAEDVSSGRKEGRELHAQLLAHLESAGEEDPVRMQEITYHALMAGDRAFLLRYIGRYEFLVENSGQEDAQAYRIQKDRVTAILAAAARDVRDFSLADGGELFCEILKEAADAKTEREILGFVNYELDSAFGISQRELETQVRIVETAFELARARMAREGSDLSRRDFTTTCYTLGAIYLSLGSSEYVKKTMRMYDEALAIRETLYEKEKSTKAKKLLASAVAHVAGVCKLEGSADALRRAAALYQRAMALREEIMEEMPSDAEEQRLADACESLAKMQRMLGTRESLETARSLCRRALAIREHLCETDGSVMKLWKLADTCSSAGMTGRTIGGRRMLKEASGYYRRAHAIYKRIDREKKTVDSRRDLAFSYLHQGGLFCSYGDRGRLLEAYRCGRQALDILLQLMRELETADARDDVAGACLRMSDICLRLGDQKHIGEAYAWAQKEVAIREQLAEELKTLDSRESLAAAYDSLAYACRMTQEQKKLSEAFALYTKSEELREALLCEQNTLSARVGLAECLRAVGFLEMELGRAPGQYIDKFKRVLTLLEEVDRERGTDDSREALAYAHFQLAQACLRAGGDVKIRQADELCQTAIQLQRETAENQNMIQSRILLMTMYLQAGEICNAAGVRAENERALLYYEKALAIGTALPEEDKTPQGMGMVIHTCLDMGTTCHMLGGKEQAERAEALFREALTRSEQYVEEYHTPEGRDYLIRSCGGLAGIFRATKDAAKMEEAGTLLGRVVRLWEEAAQELDTPYSRDCLADAWLKLGEFCAEYPDPDHIGQAKELFEKALALRLDLHEEGYHEQGERGLPACYMALCNLCSELGGEENHAAAYAYAKKAEQLYAELLKESRSAFLCQCMAEVLMKIGDIRMECAGTSDLMSAEEAYQKAYAIASSPEAEPETLNGRELLARCCIGNAGLKEAHEDEAGRQSALDWYKQAYALRRENLRQEKNANTILNYAMSCRYLGILHYKLEGKEHLKEALLLHREEESLLLAQEGRLDGILLRQYLTGTYEYIGNTLRRLGGEENCCRAMEAYEKYLQLTETVAEESELLSDARRVAVACEKIGDICIESGPTRDLSRAIRMYEKEKEIWESLKDRLECRDYLRGMAITWQKLGTLYKIFEEAEADNRAVSCVRQALGFWQQLREETGMAKDERDIAICYERLGDLCQRDGGEDRFGRALAYYGQEEEVWRRLIDALGTADARRGLSYTLGKQAAVYRQLAGEENRSKEIALRAQKLELDRTLAEELGTAKALMEYGRSCRRLGRACADGDSREEAEQALLLYQEYAAVGKQIEAEVEDIDLREELCTAWQMIASLYKRLGGQEALEASIRAYEEALSYREPEEMQKESGENRTERMKICTGIATGYMSMGTAEAYEKALPFSETACALAEETAAKEPSAENRDSYALCLMNLGRLCCVLGDEAHVEEGLARLREAIKIAEELDRESGVIYQEQILTAGCMFVGDFLYGRDQESEEALACYRKALVYGENAAAKRNTVANLDNYIVALYKVIVCRISSLEEKMTCAERMLELSGPLYERTGNPRHKQFVEMAAGLLQILNGE